MRFPQIGRGRWDVKAMDLDLDLGLGPWGLDLGTGTLDLDLQEQREMRWVFLATARFLFPRLAGL